MRPLPPGLTARLEAEGLALLGGFHPGPDDGVPGRCGTLLLLGPGAGFWDAVTAAPEFADGAADPLDRWSTRLIGTLAEAEGGTALFPFGGPPWLPFHKWAIRSGRVFASPVQLLVHAEAGLMLSFRGALALPGRHALPSPLPRPCDSCERPCLTACPVSALTGEGYDLPACHGFLDSDAGAECMAAGCRVRRACPVSAGAGRTPAQSAFHMRAFHP
jgi:ferredoxin